MLAVGICSVDLVLWSYLIKAGLYWMLVYTKTGSRSASW